MSINEEFDSARPLPALMSDHSMSINEEMEGTIIMNTVKATTNLSFVQVNAIEDRPTSRKRVDFK